VTVPIDLHTHSSASDGTDSAGDLVRAAAAAGLDVVALTDHDTTSGWGDARSALSTLSTSGRPANLRLVPGAEISCSVRGVSVHLLAYLFDPADEELAAEMRRAYDDRVPRAMEIVRLLGEAGHAITWADVLAQTEPGTTIGRPHVADAMVAAGVVPDRDAAFADYLHNDGPFYVRHYAVDPERAVRLVRAAGGVPVLAHPAADTRGRTVTDADISALAAAGLAGIEVDHRDNPPAARERLRGLARDLGLLTTGASDYHGTGKPNRLGEHTTSVEVFQALVEQSSGARVVAA
jgi:predicted metal-dependent phosphoesterase TrpH